MDNDFPNDRFRKIFVKIVVVCKGHDCVVCELYYLIIIFESFIAGSTIAGDYGPSSKHGKGGDRPGGKRPVIKTPGEVNVAI